ncbi:DUF1439 domain-containing protein [Marinomonas ostreistagni]|uniref:DUF1439 domain-containing protein n=1 Tax=Marinomonas ostreistagni TaxID=359209 RepID=A0ABS0Z8G6_9GAMM|nr:DUF1439 domain-containing protein [Marinomonas ostreistagni]MBJ7549919.1 DUF1439 domain-containing protein [Marinomonas ostreistagni]
MLKRNVFWLLSLVSALFLTGCTDMSVSEQELNQEVTQRLKTTQPDVIQLTLEESTLNLDLLIKNADIDLTQRDGGLVMVDLKTDIRGVLNVFGQDMTMTAQLDPSFESGLRIEEDRVYLVGAKLTQVSVQGSSISDQMLRNTLGSLHDEFESALARYFDTHPVYVLNHSAMEKAAAKMVKDIVITDDSIEFMIF